jgi:hypothetical protein
MYMGMNTTFLKITLSRAAERSLASRRSPLKLELELFFSCLIRKQVQVVEVHHRDARPLDCSDPRLDVAFRAVMTHTCDFDQPHTVEAFPLARAEAFLPRWLKLDFVHGDWRGEYGY